MKRWAWVMVGVVWRVRIIDDIPSDCFGQAASENGVEMFWDWRLRKNLIYLSMICDV